MEVYGKSANFVWIFISMRQSKGTSSLFHNILRLLMFYQISFHHKRNDARLLLINMVCTTCRTSCRATTSFSTSNICAFIILNFRKMYTFFLERYPHATIAAGGLRAHTRKKRLKLKKLEKITQLLKPQER